VSFIKAYFFINDIIFNYMLLDETNYLTEFK